MIDSKAVAVRPLGWSTPSSSANYPEWRTHNIDIGFEAVIDTSRALCFGKFPLAINGHTVHVKFDTLEAAKAAAQADYDARILSALTATSPAAEIAGTGGDGWQPWATVPRDEDAVLATDHRVQGGFPQIVFSENGRWAVHDAHIAYDEGFFTHWRRDCLASPSALSGGK